MKNRDAIFLVLVLILVLLTSLVSLNFIKNNNRFTENKESVSDEQNFTEYKNETSSDLTSWQEEWINYESKNRLLFRYPKFIAGKGCNSESKSFFVPTKVFEDTDNREIYIAPEYYYDENETQTCKKYITSLDSLQKEFHKPFLGWNISIRSVEKNEDINALIKDIYGSGCEMRSKNPWIKDGISEIKLNSYEDAKGNPTSLDQTVCPTNYSYEILYSEKRKRAISVIFGQECTFWGDDQSKCLDEQLINSFELK